jgi:hypothetical protein
LLADLCPCLKSLDVPRERRRGTAVNCPSCTLLTVRVPQADKRGNRNIVFVQAGQENVLPVDEPTFERLRPLLDALSSAGISIPV